MNFFNAQNQAKRNTLYLLFLLCLGVLGVVLCISVIFVFLSTTISDEANLHWLTVLKREASTLLAIAAFIGTSIFLASLYQWFQLSKGGHVVAKRLGGKRLDRTTSPPETIKILNIVEEMALASGVPTPAVFWLPDESINAFAAGTSADKAVIGITQGALHHLSRDELQGIVAHEFSHILHDDMALNTQLVGVLYGLQFLSQAGFRLMEHIDVDDIFAFLILLLPIALILLTVGSIGSLFAWLIRAAVCRQREFLADAAAVQFTRHPAGLAGALKKIGGCLYGSRLSSKHTREFSHMYFNTGYRSLWVDFAPTHPPLSVRIRLLEPHWDGQYVIPQDTRSNPLTE